MGSSFGPAADANNGWRIAIEKSQVAVGSGVIQMLIQIPGAAELTFHLVDQLQRAHAFGASQLTEIHSQVVVGGGRVGFPRDGFLASREALLREARALRVRIRKFRQIKASAAELPRCFGIRRLLLVACVCLLELLLRISGWSDGLARPRVVGLAKQRTSRRIQEQTPGTKSAKASYS